MPCFQRIPSHLFQKSVSARSFLLQYFRNQYQQGLRVCLQVIIGISNNVVARVRAKRDDGRRAERMKRGHQHLLVEAWNGMTEDEKIESALPTLFHRIVHTATRNNLVALAFEHHLPSAQQRLVVRDGENARSHLDTSTCAAFYHFNNRWGRNDTPE
jgi:hypothetical protein